MLRSVERQAETQRYKKAVRRLEASGYDLDEAVFDGVDLEAFEELAGDAVIKLVLDCVIIIAAYTSYLAICGCSTSYT
jgi:hypothetical protein